MATIVHLFASLGSRILHACISSLRTCNGFTPCTGGFLSPQLTLQGVSKGVCYVRPRTFQGPCVGALSLTHGGYPYHHPSTLTQAAGAAAGPDRVWRNRSERGRADRCAVAG